MAVQWPLLPEKACDFSIINYVDHIKMTALVDKDDELPLVERPQEDAIADAGFDILLQPDAVGKSPLDIAVESGDAIWISSFLTTRLFDALQEEDYSTSCGMLASASRAPMYLLKHEKLGSLQDLTFSELLARFSRAVPKPPNSNFAEPPATAGATLQLCTLQSPSCYFPTGWSDQKKLAVSTFAVKIACEVLVMEGVLSREHDFLARLCLTSIPDATEVFSTSAVVALIRHRWNESSFFSTLSSCVPDVLHLCNIARGPCLHTDEPT